jgi:hypothetical protein
VAFKTAARVVEAQYEWPLQSHASMGPACAVADVKGERCTVWTGSQKPHYVRSGVARLIGVPPENVRAIWVTGPGSYGRNDAGDAALMQPSLQTHRQAGARTGMREDGIAWDPKGPACAPRPRRADASGKVSPTNSSPRASRINIATNESDRHSPSAWRPALTQTERGQCACGVLRLRTSASPGRRSRR